MKREELRAYLEAQIEEIQKYKWIESERQSRDIGFQRAALEWINLYSESFRHQWFGPPQRPSSPKES
jgi:hypothetical protein